MSNNKSFYLLLFILALIVNFIGITTDFFTDDPGLYAALAKNLIYKKDLLQLFTYNQDWLDKPHFPFWAVWVSFKLFGISAWAYRLPALLFFMLSVLYTYLFTRKFYSKEVAVTAVLILMTAQHALLSNVDVRAEPYLMGLIMGSIYHIACYNERFNLKHFLLAALLTACAVMTKGIFVIVPIYGSLFFQLISQKKCSDALKPKWWLLFLATVVFTLPEFYALYIQFDLHPEKTVFGKHNVSGIRWFLWDSQFGRFVNNGPIKQKSSGNIFFFLHTLLWAFAPWCLLFYYAVYRNLKSIVQKIKLPEYYTLSGALLLLALFSLSRFQLPFYTNIIFPLFAIITAPFCFIQLSRAAGKFRLIALSLFASAFPIVTVVLHVYLKPASNVLFMVDCLLFGAVALLIVLKVKVLVQKVFLLTCCAVLFANFYLNTVLFKTMAAYNAQVAAANYINEQQPGQTHIYSLRLSNNIFQFYCKQPVDFLPMEQFNTFSPPGKALFYVSQQTLDYLNSNHATFKVVKTFTGYNQENIRPEFINSATRHSVLEKAYLISK